MNEAPLINFKCPKELRDKFDKAWKKVLYTNRTQVLQALMRDFTDLVEKKKET